MGPENIQEAEPGDVAPSLFGSRWKWAHSHLHKEQAARAPSCPCPTVPQLSLGAAQPNCKPSHGYGLDSFLQQRLCLTSALGRHHLYRGLLTNSRDSSKLYILAAPMMGWISYHCSCLFLSSPFPSHLGFSHWHPQFLVQAGLVIPACLSSTLHSTGL